MKQPLPTEVPSFTGPRFYITGRQPLRTGPFCWLSLPPSVQSHRSCMPWSKPDIHISSPTRPVPRARRSGAAADDDKDDPNQIDTILLGDPADAPVPARRGDHVSPVHPTILVRLPRFADQVGLIPDTPAGRLLYDWLAAFNQASYPALGNCACV